jgi:hypothetical protein
MNTKLFNRIIATVIITVTVVIFSSCVKDPTVPEIIEFIAGKNGAMIVCEGLWNTDNATITRIDFETGSYSYNYFSESNNGQKLGDLGNDLIILDTVGFVAVSGTGTIEAFSMKNGKSLGRIKFPNYVQPRKMCVVNDTVAFVTAYIAYSTVDFFVYKFNPQNLAKSQENLEQNKILVGSHPEGIAYANGKLFTVNCGYGDICADQPTASTISVIDINLMQATNCIKTGYNPNKIYYKNDKIYVVCWGTYENNKDENPNCLIEYNANSMQELRRWTTTVYDICIDASGENLYYLNSSLGSSSDNNNSMGVNVIALNEADAQPKQIIANNSNSNIWTCLAINEHRNELWIGNAFKFGTDGEVMAFDLKNPTVSIQTIDTGPIPNTIKFY